MTEHRNKQRPAVTDAEIEAIIAQGEAGINDLVSAYEPVERGYIQSVEAGGPMYETIPAVSCTDAHED